MDQDIYVVWRLEESGTKGNFLFAGPLSSVEMFLWIQHKDAMQRVVREGKEGCDLFGVGRFRALNVRVEYWGAQWQLLGENAVV